MRNNEYVQCHNPKNVHQCNTLRKMWRQHNNVTFIIYGGVPGCVEEASWEEAILAETVVLWSITSRLLTNSLG